MLTPSPSYPFSLPVQIMTKKTEEDVFSRLILFLLNSMLYFYHFNPFIRPFPRLSILCTFILRVFFSAALCGFFKLPSAISFIQTRSFFRSLGTSLMRFEFGGHEVNPPHFSTPTKTRFVYNSYSLYNAQAPNMLFVPLNMLFAHEEN